jgi:PhnB protein
MPIEGREKGPFTVTPYIIVKGGAAAIAFYEKAFGAVEQYRLAEPNGRIGHAEVKIGDSTIMLADESPSFGALSPPTIGGTPVNLHLYVEDVDTTIKRAEAAGAIVLRPPEDQFYGDRSGMIADPFGHHWHLATRIKVVSPAEMQEKYAEMFKSP